MHVHARGKVDGELQKSIKPSNYSLSSSVGCQPKNDVFGSETTYIYKLRSNFLFHHTGVPSLPLNLTTFNYYAVENNTSWFMITISWLPPSLGSSLHVGIDQYIINISPLPNYSYAVPFVTTNTTAFLTLHHNIVYNITVEAVNCAGRGEKAHISCIYEEPVIHGMYVN